jgi:hypothetical protein
MFVAGQDWDVIASVIPTINDNTLQWFCGNLGDRRPMLEWVLLRGLRQG